MRFMPKMRAGLWRFLADESIGTSVHRDIGKKNAKVVIAGRKGFSSLRRESVRDSIPARKRPDANYFDSGCAHSCGTLYPAARSWQGARRVKTHAPQRHG